MAKRDFVVEDEEQETVTPIVALTPDQLRDIVSAAGQSSAAAAVSLSRRENPDYNERSVFTTKEGQRINQKTPLRRDTFFCGMRQRGDNLTEEEVTLFNRFDSNKSARNGTWTAEVSMNGSRETVRISVPTNSADARASLPSGLSLILRELLDGEDAVNVGSMTDELAKLRNRVAELEGRRQ